MKIIITKEKIFLLFGIIIYLSIGPIFYHLPIKLVFLIIFLFCFVLCTKAIDISKKAIIFYFGILLFLITNIVTSIKNGTSTPFISSIICSASFFIIFHYSIKTITKLTEILTVIFKYLLILAWVGLIYSIFFGPLFITTYNERPIYFYLTTFGTQDIILTRPSAIYDEPGAFSFFICLLVALRTKLGLNSKTSLYLILGGFVTQSLAHIIFSAIWIFSIIIKDNNKKKRLSILIACIVFGFVLYKSNIIQWQINRTEKWIENPQSSPRILSYYNVLKNIEGNKQNFIYGFNKKIVAREEETSDYGENVLTPLIYGGILASWPFYLFIGFCFCYPLFKSKQLYLIGIGLLLFQRPYLLELPYSFCIALLINLLIKKHDCIK